MIRAIGYGTGNFQSMYADPCAESGQAAAGAAAGSVQRTGRYGTAASFSERIIYDKKDLNKDGFVSSVEELIYASLHPGDATEVQPSESPQPGLTGNGSYNSQGSLNSTASRNLIDIMV